MKGLKQRFILLFMMMAFLVSCGNKVQIEDLQTEEMSDIAVEEKYQEAKEAMEWFRLTTMPLDSEASKEYQGEYYAKVSHSKIQTRSDLERYLHTLFSDEIVTDLLKDNRYMDIDGFLYARPADRGSDITKGEETNEIIREGDAKIQYQVTVEILDVESEDWAVVDYKVYDQILEKVNDNWIFTQFSLIR